MKNIQSRFDLARQYLRSLWSYDPNKQYSLLAGPSFVQVQTVDKCNAACGMCPYASRARKGHPHYMDEKLYEKILINLKKVGTVRMFSPMLQSEPLLDPHIVHRVRQAKEVLGEKTVVGIVTNGSLLTSGCAKSLAEAGIDRIEISIDAVDEETFQGLRPGISFSRVIENTTNLLAAYPGIKVVARFLYHEENVGQEKVFKHFWRSKGADVLFTPLVNRAGFVTTFNEAKRSKKNQLIQMKRELWHLMIRFVIRVKEPIRCVLPFSWMYILLDGTVVLCCHDWGPLDTLGNLQTQTVEEVWNGEKLNGCRHLLWTNRYAESLICRNCSVVNGA